MLTKYNAVHTGPTVPVGRHVVQPFICASQNLRAHLYVWLKHLLALCHPLVIAIRSMIKLRIQRILLSSVSTSLGLISTCT